VSEADRKSLHASMADEVYEVGVGSESKDTYCELFVFVRPVTL